MTIAAAGGSTLAASVRRAADRIEGIVRRTPLEPSARLRELTGTRSVWIKSEHLQHTGSFKVRGAVNALACLSEAELAEGVVAASTGNHGMAVAWAAQRLGCRARIFVPKTASETKLSGIRRLGAEIERHGTDGVEAERRARLEAESLRVPYLSPYNDRRIVAGQGTVGVELAAELAEFDTVYVAVGGGGLISGVAGYLAEERPEVRVVGCSPQRSPVMEASVRAGKILDLASGPTLSDGTAGGVERDAITFPACRALVDDWVRVSEEEIRLAMIEFMESHRQLIEGAAGVALAAFVKSAADLGAGRAVVIACGGNISLDTLRAVLAGETP